MKFLLLTLTVAGCLSTLSCGPLQPPVEVDPDAKEPQTPQRRHVGQIASINAQEGFVLIRRSPSLVLPPGTILIAIDGLGQASNLRVSGESLGLLIAADIQSGAPKVGDTVYDPVLNAAFDEDDSAR